LLTLKKEGKMKRKSFLFLLASLLMLVFLTTGYAMEKKMVKTCYTGPLPVPKVAKTITAIEAYNMVLSQPNTYLIDVRTRAEYQLIGHACYKKGGMTYMAYNFPVKFWTGKVGKKSKYGKGLNKNFVKEMSKKFKKTDMLLIMCRSGDRSVVASDLLTKAGFKNVYNIKYGFEGKPLSYGKSKAEKKLMKKYSFYYNVKSRLNGWRSYGLCQSYKMDPDFMYPPDFK
jgi:rhodanese-related sulfurtransferase